MVVLVLVSLIVALALPNLQQLYDSATRNTQRDRLLDQLAVLGQETALLGRNRAVLGTIGTVAALDDVAAAQLGEVVALDVPDGWDIRVDKPLVIRANGVCLGAEVELLHRGEIVERLNLDAPFCVVERDRE